MLSSTRCGRSVTPYRPAEVGEGHVTGEICTLFNTVHDATLVAGVRGCRLWGLSRVRYERVSGVGAERGRRRGLAAFTPFEAELPVFSSMEAARLEHQLAAAERRRSGQPPVELTESHVERCLRAVPVRGTLLERIIRRASPCHRLAELEEKQKAASLIAVMNEVVQQRAVREARARRRFTQRREKNKIS